MFETARQIPLFLSFLLQGVILGTIYDILRVIRFKNKLLIIFADVLFSVCFFCLTAFFTVNLNFGQMRFYFILAIFIGFLLERISVGYFIKIFIDFWAKIIYNLYILVKQKIKVKDKHDGKG